MDVGRQARRNLGGMPAARVREILELARVPIASEIGRYRMALRRCGSIDEDDLRSLGQIAALEAAQTHDPTRGSELRSWIGFLVRQRITEAMKDAGDQATLEVALGSAYDIEVKFAQARPATGSSRMGATQDVGHQRSHERSSCRLSHSLGAHGLHMGGMLDAVSYDPLEAYEFANAREWVERSLAGLSPRQKILIAQLLGNACESYRELSATLGVDKSRVFQDFQTALTALQVRVHRPARVRREELLARLAVGSNRREVRQCA